LRSCEREFLVEEYLRELPAENGKAAVFGLAPIGLHVSVEIFEARGASGALEIDEVLLALWLPGI
jgi:hypothetical protein